MLRSQARLCFQSLFFPILRSTRSPQDYIIGMVKSIDPSDSLVLDGENHSGFAGKLASYHENMYKDILTNVYNRRYYEEQLKSNRM